LQKVQHHKPRGELLAGGKIKRTYLAIVEGIEPPSGIITPAIAVHPTKPNRRMLMKTAWKL
jgi:23S rRNA-/tRNA-specific pseudouridylate synthase